MILLRNAVIVTSSKEAEGSVLIDGELIGDILWKESPDYEFRIFKLIQSNPDIDIRDLSGKHIIAGDYAEWKRVMVEKLGRRL